MKLFINKQVTLLSQSPFSALFIALNILSYVSWCIFNSLSTTEVILIFGCSVLSEAKHRHINTYLPNQNAFLFKKIIEIKTYDFSARMCVASVKRNTQEKKTELLVIKCTIRLLKIKYSYSLKRWAILLHTVIPLSRKESFSLSCK